MKQILRNTGYTDQVVFYLDGTATDADGAVTVTVTDADGTDVVTDAATNKTSTGTYTYTLGPFADLTELTSAWTGTFSGLSQTLTTHTSIVGGFLFTEAAARAFDGAEFASETTYTDAAIVSERDRITDLLEQATGVSWVPRYGSHTTTGDGSTLLDLPDLFVDSVLSTTISGTSVSDVTVTGKVKSRLYRPSGWTYRSTPENITVTYDYGKRSLEDGVDRIALILLRDRLAPSNVPFRVWRMSNEMGTTDYTQPGPNRPFGIPEVDAWVRAHDHRLPL